MKSVCVYSGCSDLIDSTFFSAAKSLGKSLASRKLTLVYGAGKTGLMGILADAVLGDGGDVIGIVPEALNQPQLIHASLTSLEVLPDIQQRKQRMADLADGFIALPGGFGTLDEFFEILTWAQIGLHHKPIGLLNTNHYFAPLMSMFDNALKYGFIYPEHLHLVKVHEDPETLLDQMAEYKTPSDLSRWVSRSSEYPTRL